MISRRILYSFFLCLAFTFSIKKLVAQKAIVDSGYIKPFDKPDVVEIYPGFYSTKFDFIKLHQRATNFSLKANSSAYTGIYLNYKWVSLKYSWAMPGTSLDKNVKLKYTSVDFRFGERKMIFHPFYNSYNGLLESEEKQEREFTAFKDMQISTAGLDYYYVTNLNQFSFRAGNYFSEQQIKSAGAIFFMLTPMWQKLNWKTPSISLIKDTATFTLLSSNPQWVSFVSRIGYAYNFSIGKGKWLISPAFLLGAGGLHELNNNRKGVKGVTDMQAWLNAGYNGAQYYFYLNAWWDNLQTNLFIKNLHQVNTDISITAGFRFGNANHKILGIL